MCHTCIKAKNTCIPKEPNTVGQVPFYNEDFLTAGSQKMLSLVSIGSTYCITSYLDFHSVFRLVSCVIHMDNIYWLVLSNS